jgi:carbonic anhydrase/acetyltransferase-like protein (isoleucine patch superfamily)
MNSIRPFQSLQPQIDPTVWVDPTAVVIGDVEIGAEASIWPLSVVRGDIHSIKIGPRSNIQDGGVVHVTHDSRFNPGGHPVVIGSDVTVGHKVMLHGCSIGDRCLIGMGSVVGAAAGVEAPVRRGAGRRVPGGTARAGRYLWFGSPVRRVRPLTTEELEFLDYSAGNYVKLAQQYRQGAISE